MKRPKPFVDNLCMIPTKHERTEVASCEIHADKGDKRI